MGKLIFLDIDGTIRDFDGYIPESTVEAVHQAREEGHKVFLCTGRPYFQIESRIKEIGFDGIISGSGSAVELDGKRIKHDCFTLLTYIALCNYLTSHGMVIEIQTSHSNYVLEQDLEHFSNVGKMIMEKIGVDTSEVRNMPKVVKTVMDVSDVEKVLYFGNSLSIQEIRKEWGEDLYIVPLSIPNIDNLGGEINPISVNKSEAIKSILEALEMNRSDVIAIGDSENDLEMVKYAGTGIAMGNATPKLKEVADYVTDSIRHDGVAKAFRKFVFE